MHQLLSALGSILTGTWEMFLLLAPLFLLGLAKLVDDLLGCETLPTHHCPLSRSIQSESRRKILTLKLDPFQRGRSLKNSPEQLTRHGDLRHLKGDAPGVGNRLRADLHPILPKRPQQPVFHR